LTFVAGVDVGNSTTEIVIAEDGRPLLWDRMPTRGVKGSVASGAGAARLLARMEHRLGRPVDVAVLTPQRPVESMSMRVAATEADLGRLVLLSTGVSSPGGAGVGTGRPVRADSAPDQGDDPVVVVAADPLGFRRTVEQVRAWQSSVHDVVGVLLAGDEARLVSRRLGSQVPVVDCVDAESALACERICIEVASEDSTLTVVTDPLRLAAQLDLAVDEHGYARSAADALRAARSAAIGVSDLRSRADSDVEHFAVPSTVGEIRSWLRPDGSTAAVDDLWLVDLGTLPLPGLRADALADRGQVIAALSAEGESSDHISGFRERWGGDVRVLSSEIEAGRLGALSTPTASPDALVIDLGGGTIDISDRARRITAAGSGDMLTVAIADALGISRGAAEWVKRGPSRRIDSPSSALLEDGTRVFLDRAAATGTVGWLVCAGPGGSLPFSPRLAPAEWRSIRLALKTAVIGDNVRRAMAGLGSPAGEVVLVGGPAGDDELLDALASALPQTVAGRADAAGVLGHRWAVAWGLVLAAA
jgi:hypothetical protein